MCARGTKKIGAGFSRDKNRAGHPSKFLSWFCVMKRVSLETVLRLEFAGQLFVSWRLQSSSMLLHNILAQGMNPQQSYAANYQESNQKLKLYNQEKTENK